MEQENSSVVVALQVKKVSFLDEEVQLKKIGRELSKTTKDAIDVLVEMLKHTDSRLRMQAATKLLELDIDVKKSISQDSMQRMIAEIRFNGSAGTKRLELEGEEGRSMRPVVNFSEIRSI